MEETIMTTRYCGYRVRIAIWDFGTSGTTYRIIAQTEAGKDRKDHKEWRFRSDPSANGGHGAVVEDTRVSGQHVIDNHGGAGVWTDACPCDCYAAGEELDPADPNGSAESAHLAGVESARREHEALARYMER
ncbi:MAG: hypothetical protein KGL35_27570 [Bradyrhizobium sp.]|nr:hypothetical protein [Bradyrhizobium sp.]